MFEVMFQQLINWHSEILISYSHFIVSNVSPALCLGWVFHVSEGKWSLVKTTDLKPLKTWTSDINCYQNIKIVLFSFLFMQAHSKMWFSLFRQQMMVVTLVMENKENRGCARHQWNLRGRVEIRLSPQNEMCRLHCNASLHLQIRELILLSPRPW